MKRFAWLLALPWVVKMSTCTLGEGNPGENLWLNGSNHEVLTCNSGPEAKEGAETLAFALNEAHEKRIKDKVSDDFIPPITEEDKPSDDDEDFSIEATPERQITRPKQRSIGGTQLIEGQEFDYKAACGQDDCGREP